MSTLHSSNLPLTLSNEDIANFKANGYLHLENVWSQSDIKILRHDMDRVVNGDYKVRLDLHKYLSMKLVHTSKRMCDITDTIFKARGIPVGSGSFFCKPNNVNELGTIWHQDNYAPMCPNPDHYLNLALSIDDADSSNGSLIVVPGSHLYGMLKFEPSPNFTHDKNGELVQCKPIGDTQSLSDYSLPDGSSLPSDLEPIQLEYCSGDVLVIHSQLIHKANKNNHPFKWRRTVYFTYVRENEPFWPGWNAKRELLDRYDSQVFK